MPFFESRDFELFQSLNKELINRFVETPVVIYRQDVRQSETNIYGESVGGKSFMIGLLVNCLIQRDDQTTEYEGFGSDARQNLQFRFLRRTLEEVNFKPAIGDVIKFNNNYYEVGGLVENELVAGNTEFANSVICNTTMARRSKYNFEEMI